MIKINEVNLFITYANILTAVLCEKKNYATVYIVQSHFCFLL